MTAAALGLMLAIVDIGNLPGNNCYPAFRRHAPEVLKHYRYPVASDLVGYWEFYIGEYGDAPFCGAGDLNNDGVVDYMAVLLARQQPGVRVIALLSNRSRGRSSHVLFESTSAGFLPQRFVVEIVPPGVHKWLCAFLYDDADAVPPVRLSRPAARFWITPPPNEPLDPSLNYLYEWQASEAKFVRTKPCGEK